MRLANLDAWSAVAYARRHNDSEEAGARPMALKDTISFGMSLPHRSPEPIDMLAVRQVAQRADALGFRDLWVTENTLDHVFCFDPMVVLTYAAAVTTSIRLGVAVVVLPVHDPISIAHQVATLDYVSNGRAILGVGLGRDHHYTQFQVPREHRVRRFREGVELIKALWTEPEGQLPGQHLPARRRHHGSQAGAEAASADLAGRRPPRCAPPRRRPRRRVDGRRRLEHG